MVDPDLVHDDKKSFLGSGEGRDVRGLEEERAYAIELLERHCAEEQLQFIERFFSYFSREIYNKGDVLWRQGAKGDSAKLLVSGNLISTLENEAGTTETISIGSVIGESGLVQNRKRNSTVNVLEDNTVLYCLSRESWEVMKQNDPKAALLLYGITVRYLNLRVQHVSNRIWATRCLPI